MPRVVPTVSRRRVLVGTTAMALLGATGTACGSTPPLPEVDALVGQFERARNDNALATAAATGVPPSLAKALAAVATQRAAHAVALGEEITRVSGEAPPTTSSPSPAPTSPTSGTSTTTSGPPPAPPTAAAVVASIKQSADGASLAASQQSGYRAGLLGSIAAACTAAVTVTLAEVGPNS